MPSTDHPWLLVAASIVCIALAFPLGRFFFDDFESFLDEVGLSSDPNRELWRLIFFPGSPMLLLKVIGFLGLLFIAFIAVFSLGLRLAGAK